MLTKKSEENSKVVRRGNKKGHGRAVESCQCQCQQRAQNRYIKEHKEVAGKQLKAVLHQLQGKEVPAHPADYRDLSQWWKKIILNIFTNRLRPVSEEADGQKQRDFTADPSFIDQIITLGN